MARKRWDATLFDFFPFFGLPPHNNLFIRFLLAQKHALLEAIRSCVCAPRLFGLSLCFLSLPSFLFFFFFAGDSLSATLPGKDGCWKSICGRGLQGKRGSGQFRFSQLLILNFPSLVPVHFTLSPLRIIRIGGFPLAFISLLI